MSRGGSLGGALPVVPAGACGTSLTSWMEWMVKVLGAFGTVYRGRELREFSGLGMGHARLLEGKRDSCG